MTLSGELCICGHDKAWHHKQGADSKKSKPTLPCMHQTEGFKLCDCKNFKPAQTAGNSQTEVQIKEDEAMAKKNGKSTTTKRPKGEGRKPSLAEYVDSSFKIYATTGGKEYEATVLSSGIIKMDDKEYTSPSAAGSALLGKDKKGKPRQVDGWIFWKFNKDGERVVLDMLRGGKVHKAIKKAAKEAAAAA